MTPLRRAGLLAIALFAGGAAACGGPRAVPPPKPVERLNAEGVRRLDRGDVAGAEAMFRDALREAELVDDLAGEAEAWDNSGALAMARGKLDQARACHTRAVELWRDRGVRGAGEVRARANLGTVLLAEGRVDDARAQFEEADRLAAAIGQPGAAALARVGLATVRLRAGDAAGAESLAVSATAAADVDDAARAAALALLGAAREARGDHDGARARLELALALDRKRGVPRAVLDDLRALARVEEAAARPAAAAAIWARSARVARRLGDLDGAGRDLERAAARTRAAGGDASAIEAERAALGRAK